MIGAFGETKVYHPDELLELTDPVGSTRIPCKLVRRLHPGKDFFFYLNSEYLNSGFFIIEEFCDEYEEETAEFCDGTVCLDDKGRASWWKCFGEDWRRVNDEF